MVVEVKVYHGVGGVCDHSCSVVRLFIRSDFYAHLSHKFGDVIFRCDVVPFFNAVAHIKNKQEVTCFNGVTLSFLPQIEIPRSAPTGY